MYKGSFQRTETIGSLYIRAYDAVLTQGFPSPLPSKCLVRKEFTEHLPQYISGFSHFRVLNLMFLMSWSSSYSFVDFLSSYT